MFVVTFIFDRENILDIVKLLLKYDADINLQDENGNTVLMLLGKYYATNQDYYGPQYEVLECFSVLLPIFIEHGADVNIKNNYGINALDMLKGSEPLMGENDFDIYKAAKNAIKFYGNITNYGDDRDILLVMAKMAEEDSSN